MKQALNRRRFLKGTAIATAGMTMSHTASADLVAGQDGYPYEITKTDAEWRAQLGDFAFGILREGKTEPEGSSPMLEDKRAGHFECKGCDLPLYQSIFRVYPGKGWVFFRVAEPNSLLAGIDGPNGATMDPNFNALLEGTPELGELFSIEVHCRRCGSHMGHILPIKGQALHCIDGTSLNLVPA
ncbi:peptide-methionine (R)-S-oxide reductase [Oceaniovalibus sp. ACAM 378]|uniref:peptide-methionine (R)-S-oxide reductase n=1 Tax=Oceaniovalibus sp. ACAM 378 TaxID=2599923 RepID=UPI0011D67860|nr:peptide-methionine (R)-S-oxide reductase [Oceaniovalibus sp. ACAM 378]TYB90307.1 twin-arginine translocation signal domain-containing protein [Oceaniovalibus sp. ACAM 378]